MSTDDKKGNHGMSREKLVGHLKDGKSLETIKNLAVNYLQVGRDALVLRILLKTCGAVTSLMLEGNHITLTEVNSFI